MRISDLLRATKEILRREGDIQVVYGTSFQQVEPILKVRVRSLNPEVKVLVIEEPLASERRL